MISWFFWTLFWLLLFFNHWVLLIYIWAVVFWKTTSHDLLAVVYPGLFSWLFLDGFNGCWVLLKLFSLFFLVFSLISVSFLRSFTPWFSSLSLHTCLASYLLALPCSQCFSLTYPNLHTCPISVYKQPCPVPNIFMCPALVSRVTCSPFVHLWVLSVSWLAAQFHWILFWVRVSHALSSILINPVSF